MMLKRTLLGLAMTALLASAAFVAREAETPGQRMVGAAEAFLGGLDAGQAKQVAFAFDDDERFRWFFTPQQKAGKSTRKGLPLADMSEKQQTLARALLRAGTSEAGYKKATTVISLESILAELEKGGSIVRDPAWYFFSVFGTPSKTGRWGWRVEGHHLSLNFTVDGGKVVSATPFFLGANPADVKGGKAKGTVALPESMAPYRDLVASLDEGQDKVARQPKVLPEIKENEKVYGRGTPVGLSAGKLNEKQQKLLWTLIDGYANRMPVDVAAAELAAIKKAGLDDVYFAYGGDPKGTPGKAYSYRVQGPTFVIEFVNEQGDSAKNPANHIHSVWRSIKGDFGL